MLFFLGVGLRDCQPLQHTAIPITAHNVYYVKLILFRHSPFRFEHRYRERIRLMRVNDTMMEHSIHLHRMFMVSVPRRCARTRGLVAFCRNPSIVILIANEKTPEYLPYRTPSAVAIAEHGRVKRAADKVIHCLGLSAVFAVHGRLRRCAASMQQSSFSSARRPAIALALPRT